MLRTAPLRPAALGLLLALAAPLAGCDIDTHDTATGLTKSTGLKPGSEHGGSGSIVDYTYNAGGPGRVAPAKK